MYWVKVFIEGKEEILPASPFVAGLIAKVDNELGFYLQIKKLVDRNITKTYIDDVVDSVNSYLAHLKAKGAILAGKCYPSPELNTPANIISGKIYFDFEFTPSYPAEQITFRSHLINDHIKEII